MNQETIKNFVSFIADPKNAYFFVFVFVVCAVIAYLLGSNGVTLICVIIGALFYVFANKTELLKVQQ